MRIVKFYAYIFYRFKGYYELWQAVLAFNALLLIHTISIFALYVSVMHLETNDTWFFQSTNNYFYDRFVLGPFRIGPIFLSTYILSLVFKTRLSHYYEEFKNESIQKQKMRNRWMIIYFVFTALFLIFSLVSSSFF